MAFVEWLLSGRSIVVSGNQLEMKPAFGAAVPLIPVAEGLFRTERDSDATRVFVENDNGLMVFAGASTYAERQARWRVESVRWPVLISAALVITPLVMLIPWVVLGVSRRLVRRSAQRLGGSAKRGGGWLKTFLVLCAIAFVLPVLGIMNASDLALGTKNIWTAAMFAGTVLMPAAAILSFLFAIDAWKSGAGRWLKSYAFAVSIAAIIISGYLSAWGMIGFRPWNF